jgi:hypothetical protein
VPQGGKPPIDEPGIGLAEVKCRQGVNDGRDHPLPKQEARAESEQNQEEKPNDEAAARLGLGGRHGNLL